MNWLVCVLIMQRVLTGLLFAYLYISQITAMLLGRVLSGVCKALLFAPATFSIAAWATASFVTGLPGIIIQLVLLPSLVVALTKARLLRVRYAEDVAAGCDRIFRSGGRRLGRTAAAQ